MIIARAPLRISLGGGGTDLPSYYSRFGGHFLSAAVDKYVYIHVNRPAADDLIRVKYSRSEEVAEVKALRHDLAREALNALGVVSNVEIASMADVPAGTGMGSSGSYLVALLTALHALKKDRPTRQAVAELACHIEIDVAGHPVGKQDQYVAAFGGINTYDIAIGGEVDVRPVAIPPYAREDLQRSLVLFYLGQTRESAAILRRQNLATEGGDAELIENLHRTKDLGCRVQEALEHGDLARFGELMHEHWVNKRSRSVHISNSKIDRSYEALRQAGALGGKVIGAGGGGFLMVLVPDDTNRKRDVVQAGVESGLRNMPFAFEFDGAKVLVDV